MLIPTVTNAYCHFVYFNQLSVYALTVCFGRDYVILANFRSPQTNTTTGLIHFFTLNDFWLARVIVKMKQQIMLKCTSFFKEYI